jgi:hypothetical protein
MPGAIATLAMAEAARCCTRPISTWTRSRSVPAIPKGVVDLDAPAGENILNLAKAKGVKPEAITAMILDRPRHADMIAAVRKTGAAVSLITDGDVAGVIHTADPDKTGIDIYLGVGGAPEGVLAAAALRCIGGQMQCRLVLDTEESASASPKWASRTRARNTRSRTWCAATACSRRPASPTAACCAASSFGKGHDRDRDRGDALGHRHGALDQGRAPALCAWGSLRWKQFGVCGACVLSSIYCFLQGAWPFGLVEAIWAAVAAHRWFRKSVPRLGCESAGPILTITRCSP